MLQVRDLNVKEDLLPLFDYTRSSRARDFLTETMHQVPSALDEAYHRQGIIKGFLENWAVIGEFSYQRLDVEEVYAFLNRIAMDSPSVKSSKVKAALRLYVHDEERQRLYSKVIQTSLLFHKLLHHYFLRLNGDAYPNGFQKKLKTIITFLQKLRLSYYVFLIHADKLSVMALVEFLQGIKSLGKGEIDGFWDNFATFEAYWSIAKGVEQHSFCFPVFADGAFAIEGFYHPLLKQPVKNSLHLHAQENVLLLSGPNMSGKSTLLKAVGVCVYLAHIGFGVPAIHCTIPFFDTLSVVINANDNLQSGYSHFMTEIQNLKAVVQRASEGRKCFAVFDEIFRGTNIDDALDISSVTLTGFTQFPHCYFFVSTHLLQLKDKLPTQHIGKYHVGCKLEQGQPYFTYQLQQGWSDLKIGKIIFEHEGLYALLTQ